MTLTRRSAIKQFAFIVAGVTLIPSCMQDKSKSAILLKHMSIDPTQEKLLEALADTLIPATDTPGAKDVSTHLFTLKMLDDCYSKEDQNKFISGLKQFEIVPHKKFGQSFDQCNAEQKAAILTDLEKAKDNKDDLSYFYNTAKRLTIFGYTTSEFYLTKVQVYELVPGRYHGCVPVAATKKAS
jgi:hypothetical protein